MPEPDIDFRQIASEFREEVKEYFAPWNSNGRFDFEVCSAIYAAWYNGYTTGLEQGSIINLPPGTRIPGKA